MASASAIFAEAETDPLCPYAHDGRRVGRIDRNRKIGIPLPEAGVKVDDVTKVPPDFKEVREQRRRIRQAERLEELRRFCWNPKRLTSLLRTQRITSLSFPQRREASFFEAH